MFVYLPYPSNYKWTKWLESRSDVILPIQGTKIWIPAQQIKCPVGSLNSRYTLILTEEKEADKVTYLGRRGMKVALIHIERFDFLIYSPSEFPFVARENRDWSRKEQHWQYKMICLLYPIGKRGEINICLQFLKENSRYNWVQKMSQW